MFHRSMHIVSSIGLRSMGLAHKPCQLIAIQRFSGGEKRSEGEASSEGGFKNTIIKMVQERSSTRNLVIGGVTAASLSVAYILFDLTHAFMSLTPATSLFYGFMSGAVTAGSTAGLAWYVGRSFQISPDRAVARAMKLINKNDAVLAYIGKSRPSGIKSFYSKYGGFAVSASKASLSWESPQIQTMFVLEGTKPGVERALASVVYGKKGTFFM